MSKLEEVLFPVVMSVVVVGLLAFVVIAGVLRLPPSHGPGTLNCLCEKTEMKIGVECTAIEWHLDKSVTCSTADGGAIVADSKCTCVADIYSPEEVAKMREAAEKSVKP